MKEVKFKKGDVVRLVNDKANQNYGIGEVVNPCRETDIFWGVMPNLEAVEFYVDVEFYGRSGEVFGWHQESLRDLNEEEIADLFTSGPKASERKNAEERDWVADLKKELLRAPMKDMFNFSRSELIHLLSQSKKNDTFTFTRDQMIDIMGGVTALHK